MENMDKVWKEYGRTKSPSLKEKLILQYAHLVKLVAGRISAHIGSHVEYDDLIGYGVFGLIDAIDKFDTEKGVKFETYASLRIRGAIIDNLRKLDWVPRTLRQKNKLIDNASAELEAQLGREPSDAELAEKLNVSIDEVRELTKNSEVSPVISLDEYLELNHEAEFLPADKSNAHNLSPERLYELQEIKKMLADAIDKLSEKEKLVISLYYFEELTLKEISKVMGVTESRISQIHSKAVGRLQAKLGRYKFIMYT